MDAPAAIPETTGAGGNEFFGDVAGVVTGNTAAGDPPYWGPSGAGSDEISTALEYIPEEGWNDTTFNIANNGGFGASGGGASIYFTKPTWQTGTDGKRDVPDISLNASADHDPYLFCSEDGPNNTIVQTCTSGFRTGAGGNLTAVGGTSAAAPTFTAILALVNQFVGNTSATGLAPINPTLYQIATSSPAAFHDITTGNNKVPCTTGTTNCPSGTTEIGFSAGVGYDQVTGLGSVDGVNLAQAWAATLNPDYTLAPKVASLDVPQGSPVDATVNVTFLGTFAGTVSFTCVEPANLTESTCLAPPSINATGPVSFHITTTAATASLLRPSNPAKPNHGTGIVFALLLPGMLGVVLTAGSRRSLRSWRGIRLLGLITLLGLSTLWLPSCGGSSGGSNSNPGTPKGTYTITVNATSTGAPTVSTSFQLVVQ